MAETSLDKQGRTHHPRLTLRNRCVVVARLHLRCSGPVHSERFTSSWPRSQASLGRIGLPQLEHSRRHRRLKGERKRIRAEARLWAAEEPAWNREDQNRFDPEGVR
jgi:hypothetical protein